MKDANENVRSRAIVIIDSTQHNKRLHNSDTAYGLGGVDKCVDSSITPVPKLLTSPKLHPIVRKLHY